MFDSSSVKCWAAKLRQSGNGYPLQVLQQDGNTTGQLKQSCCIAKNTKAVLHLVQGKQPLSKHVLMFAKNSVNCGAAKML